MTGWCLEVVFTSMESILIHDWRLMGRTSLLMFPIYGCGALLAPIGSFADRWIGDGPLSRADRIIRHGLLYMVLIFIVLYVAGVAIYGGFKAFQKWREQIRDRKFRSEEQGRSQK